MDHGDLGKCVSRTTREAYVFVREENMVGTIDAPGRGRLHNDEVHSPVAITISVIIAGKVFPSGCAIRQDFEWLVNTAEKIVCVVRADPDKSVDILFYTGWWEAPHEIEHRVYRISHAVGKDDALLGRMLLRWFHKVYGRFLYYIN